MNLTEALEKLQDENIITLKDWNKTKHIKMFDTVVGRQPKVFESKSTPYIYNPSILLSQDWFHPGCRDRLAFFPDGLQCLILGECIYNASWTEDQHIRMIDNTIIYFWCEPIEYIITVAEMVSEDWEVI